MRLLNKNHICSGNALCMILIPENSYLLSTLLDISKYEYQSGKEEVIHLFPSPTTTTIYIS